MQQHDIMIQFENSEKNRNELLHDLFESDAWAVGTPKTIPGGATITLESVPLQKGIGSHTLITLGIDFGAVVTGVAINVATKWITEKIFRPERAQITININEMHVHSPESFKRRLTRLARVRKKSRDSRRMPPSTKG